MEYKSDSGPVRKVLKRLSEALNDCSIVEAIAAGIIVAQNMKNVVRPIGLINLGRNMINEMHQENDAEIVVYSNLISSILKEENGSFELLPGFGNINQHAVDQFVNHGNKRDRKDIHKFGGGQGLVRDFYLRRNPHQFEYPKPSFEGYQPFSRQLPVGGYRPSEMPAPAPPLPQVKSEYPADSSMGMENQEIPSQISTTVQKEPAAPVKKKNGKKKPVIRKHKPAANSKVHISSSADLDKTDCKPRTEVWEWSKIQKMAANDEQLSKSMTK